MLVFDMGWDSSYNVRTNVSVRGGIIRGIHVYNMHSGEVLFISSVYIERRLLQILR